MHTLLNKLRCTANYKCFSLLNVAIPATLVTSHYCFLLLYTHSITIHLNLKSDKKQITNKTLNADELHTDRHSGSAHIAATPAASLSATIKFVIFVFKMLLRVMS